MVERGPIYSFRSTDGLWSVRLTPGSEVIVGRGQGADLQLPHVALSRRHMRLVHCGGTCAVELLQTRGNIHVNDRPIPREGLVPLEVGDRIGLLGDLTLVVGVDPEPPTDDA